LDAPQIPIFDGHISYRWVDFNEYKAGSVMRDAGAVSGMDMTPEAAATKLAYLLGKGLPIDEVMMR
jgi:L-asparaginase/Glu-tRNA(Gln) amidotransferase subunit D